MVRFSISVLCVTAWFTTGCATVKFYEDGELKKETGLQYYIAKPYLLVAKTGAKNKPVEVQLVYLPDQDQPRFARFRPGLGSHDFSVTLSNGMLTSYGQKTDSKIPETIHAIGSLATSLASAAAPSKLASQELVFADRIAAAKQLRTTAQGIAADVRKPGIKNGLTPQQIKEAAAIGDRIEAAARILELPDGDLEAAATSLREDVARKLGEIKIAASQLAIEQSTFNAKIDQWTREVGDLANALGSPATPAAFELYEVKQVGGITTLVPVQLR